MFKNKSDQKASSRKHYELNTDIVKHRAVEFKKFARKRNRDFVNEYLKRHPCVDCGEADIIVLEFDHITDDKVLEVCTALNYPWSIERLINEISKCVVRCANCHRRATARRRLKLVTR